MNLRKIGVMGAALALGTVLSTSSALAQTPTPTPSPTPEQTPAPRPRETPAPQPRDTHAAEPKADHQADMAMMVEGSLESVDATTKTLVVKTAEGKEESLRYDDDTKVTGGQSGVAGLVNSKGTKVKVKFSGTGADRVASDITIGEKKQ